MSTDRAATMSTDCAICLGPCEDPGRLPCDHTFCHSCIIRWAESAENKCPLCKVPFTSILRERAAKAAPRGARRSRRLQSTTVAARRQVQEGSIDVIDASDRDETKEQDLPEDDAEDEGEEERHGADVSAGAGAGTGIDLNSDSPIDNDLETLLQNCLCPNHEKRETG